MKRLGLLSVVAITLVFIVSCVSRQVPTTETYYETEYKTEYKTETYTTVEDVVVDRKEGTTNLIPKVKWWDNWSPYNELDAFLNRPVINYYGYDISATPHSKRQIKITYSVTGYPIIPWCGLRVYDLSSIGQIGLPLVSSIIAEDRHQLASCGINSTTCTFDAQDLKEFAIITHYTSNMPMSKIEVSNVELIWSDDTIEKKEVTKERQVPYQVPVQVEKQRTIMQTKKVPFWEAIFSK